MKKLIQFLLIIAALAYLACNQHQSPQQSETGKDDSSLISSWQVKGCAEAATRAGTKFPSSGDFTDLPDLTAPGTDGIKADADSIVYTRNVNHLCCRQVIVSLERRENTITITEYWHRQGCKCKCNSTVRAVVRQLPRGDYRVIGIETGTDPVDDKPTAGKDTVVNQMISIR